MSRETTWEEKQLTRASSVTTHEVIFQTPDTLWITEDQWHDADYLKGLMESGYQIGGTFQAWSSYMERNWISKDRDFHNKLGGVNVFHWELSRIHQDAVDRPQWLLDREIRLNKNKS